MNNKKEKIIILVILVILGLIIGLFGYDYYKKHNNSNDTNNNAKANSGNINTDDGDSDIDWENYTTKQIENDGDINITEAGIYTLTGNINGTVTVNTEGNVKLILDNATIKSSNGPAIYIESADNTVIYLKEETTNTLEDSSNYSNLDEDINAVIFSKDDLVFDGTGTLVVKANYEDGIVSKDDLKIINGKYNITTSDDGIRGKDSVYIIDGIFDIDAGGDGIKASNDTDNEKGYVLIENGTFKINSKSDGIQAITKLVINNGTFDITSGEGLEATYIIINDGNIKISASDDGINASKKSTFMTPAIEVNGGNITVNMGQGDTDGFDANGNIYINGGKISVTGQSAFDYDGEGKINGGTVVVNGQEVTELPNQMMGGGMHGGMRNGNMQAPDMNGTPPDMDNNQGERQNGNRGGMRK